MGTLGQDAFEMLAEGFALGGRPFRGQPGQGDAGQFLQEPDLGLIEAEAAPGRVPGFTIQKAAQEGLADLVQFFIRRTRVPNLQQVAGAIAFPPDQLELAGQPARG